MAFVHRMAVMYSSTVVFLSLLTARLSQNSETGWNWFFVFIPLWVCDLIELTFLIVKMISHCRVGYDPSDMCLSMVNKVWFVFMLGLKISFQVVLCVRLQYARSMAIYWVFIPLWLMLGLSAVRLFPWSSKLR